MSFAPGALRAEYAQTDIDPTLPTQLSFSTGLSGTERADSRQSSLGISRFGPQSIRSVLPADT